MTQALTAHYFASRATKVVVIAEGPKPVGERIEVAGKLEARKIAAERGATPWNF
jgi:hypothetical protein